MFQISCYQRDVDGSKGWCAVCRENAKEGQPGYCPEDALPVRIILLNVSSAFDSLKRLTTTGMTLTMSVPLKLGDFATRNATRLQTMQGQLSYRKLNFTH